jgi:hypothetical protein
MADLPPLPVPAPSSDKQTRIDSEHRTRAINATEKKPKFLAFPEQWHLAWAEFGREHPTMKEVNSLLAFLIFTGLGQGLLGLFKLFYSPTLPWVAYAVMLLFTTILTQMFITHFSGKAYNRTISQLTEQLRPKLIIDYRPDEREPFVQSTKEGIQYRVGITSPVDVEHVELVANKIRAAGIDGIPNFHLRPTNDRDLKKGTKRVKLSADKEDYWDLVATHGGVPHLTCIAALGNIPLSVGDYEFELIASGVGIVTTKIVTLKVNKDNSLKVGIRDGRLSRSIITRD